MLDASTVFRCARVCSTYWSDATHPHTLDATPLSRHATLPQVPTYGVHERSEHGGLERVHRTFRTGCVRCSCKLRTEQGLRRFCRAAVAGCRAAVMGYVASLSQRCRGLSRGRRSVSPCCRGMSRTCHWDVARCRQVSRRVLKCLTAVISCHLGDMFTHSRRVGG